MTRISTQQAAEKLNLTRLTVQVLMQQERLPIGYAVKNPGSTQYHYIIYDELVDGYVRSVENGELR